MFCPKCRTEYRKGFNTCADCEIALVNELPPEPKPEPKKKPEYIKYVNLLSTYNLADIALIKSVFDAENITYYFQGENFAYLVVQPTKLMVDKDDIERAKELINDLNLMFQSKYRSAKMAIYKVKYDENIKTIRSIHIRYRLQNIDRYNR
jgi:hypothetical protein